MNNSDLEKFLQNCPFDVKVIGHSVLGSPIFAVNRFVSKECPWCLIVAGMHAREHLSCDVVCYFLDLLSGNFLLREDARIRQTICEQNPCGQNLCKHNFCGVNLCEQNFCEQNLCGQNFCNQNFDDQKCRRKNLCKGINLSFVPLANPDGAYLATGGIKDLPLQFQKHLIEINGGDDDFSLFKANANGVDLNNNWPANWEKKHTNKFAPSSQGFYGVKPLSEPENISLAKWVNKIQPFLTLSYHLKGEEIYFEFFQEGRRLERDFLIAKTFSHSTGYQMKSTPNSSGGFKDWCVQNLKIPALTIELGCDKFSHPFPKSQLETILQQNKNVFMDIEKSWEIFKKYQ